MATADQLAAALRDVPSVSSKLGTFVRRDGARVVVSFSGGQVVLPFVGTTLPPVGAAVQVESRGGVAVVTGAAAPLPGVAKVTAVSGDMVTVSAWGRSYSLRFGATYTPAVGDEVSVIWSADGGLVQDKVSAPVAVAPGAPVLQASSGFFHPGPFTAVGSGSYGSRWFTNDVYASSSNTGGWWYGSKVRDTIPDGARIDGARVFLSPRQMSGSSPVMRLHSSEGQPDGPLVFVGAPVALSGARSGWVDVPVAWVDYLKSNPGGVGFERGGYNIFRGTGSDALSGALDLSWSA